MNALFSYVRHLVTFYLTQLAVRFSLPQEGLNEAIEFVGTSLAIFLSWLIAKYAVPYIKSKFNSK